MSDRPSDADLAREVAALVRTLESLQDELARTDRRRLGLPTPRDLLRVTSEVTIPATIIVLETNVRVLRLLQRTIRSTTRSPDEDADRPRPIRDRATALGRDALRGLDASLAEVEDALEGSPPNEDAASLLADARALSDRIDAQLAAERGHADGDVAAAGTVGQGRGHDRGADGDSDPVAIDVEAELRSIKDDLDDRDDADDLPSGDAD